MLKNYFKTAWRNIRRNKTYTAINVIGLSLGIGCSILIFSIVNYHLNFDEFHHHPDRIYRIVTEFHNGNIGYSGGIQAPVAKAFRDEYTFAEKLARVYTYGGQSIAVPEEPGKKFMDNVAFAEPEYFDIFNFPLIIGNKQNPIKEPNTALITQRMAEKLFGSEDALGKVIRVSDKDNFTITGVLKNLPVNTDRRTEIYLSYASLKEYDSKIDNYWTGVYGEFECFVLLRPGVLPTAVEKLFPAFNKRHFSGDDQKTFVYKLQPLRDIHFNPDYGAVIEKKKLWILGIIGVFLLITACVNFINITTAQATNRAKEVGVRKTLGGLGSQLFWQFIIETVFNTVPAIALGYIAALIGLPFINRLFSTEITLNPLEHTQLIIFLLAIAVLIIFSAGAYPALIMSNFKAAVALKSRMSSKQGGSFSLRRILVVFQFAISQMLIIGAIVIAAQINYSTNSDLGFDKNAVVLVVLPNTDLSKMTALKTRFEEIAGVKSVSLCFQAPASLQDNYTSARFDNRDKNEVFNINTKDGDEGYVPTFGLKIIAGRNIFHSDTTREFVINETLVKRLGLHNPQEAIGKKLMTSRGMRNGIIVGVMKDFYNSSFHNEIAPVCIRSDYDSYNYCAVKINLGSTKATLSALEKIWVQTYPEGSYAYQFVDDSIAQFYALDDVMLQLIDLFSGIAIAISCLGLYGLIAFMTVQKTKEIGIRKAFGANLQQILWLFGREFTSLIVVAFLIAAPIAWWEMNNYLTDFKYHISIGANIFLITILTSFVIAALTVGFQSFKAAMANPVESLRTET